LRKISVLQDGFQRDRFEQHRKSTQQFPFKHRPAKHQQKPRYRVCPLANFQSLHYDIHHPLCPPRQSVGHRLGHETPQAPGNHQLFRSFAGLGGYASGVVCHDVQRFRGTFWTLVIRIFHVRCVEFVGRLLQYRQHSPPLLHQRRQILRDRSTAGLSVNHDKREIGNHVERRVVFPDRYELPTDLRRMVHYEGASGIQEKLSGCVCVPSQQVLCCRQFQCEFLGTGDNHDRDVLQDLSRGRSSGAHVVPVSRFFNLLLVIIMDETLDAD